MKKSNLKQEKELEELEYYYNVLVLELRKKYDCEYIYYDKGKDLRLLIHMKDRNYDLYLDSNSYIFKKSIYIPFYYKNIRIEECWTQYY